jgi:hypothetical protein
MKKEKKFLRKCIGCGEYKEKEELIKITRNYETQEIHIEPLNNVYGRSCYICKDENCLNKAFKKDKISKILRKKVDIEIKEKIIVLLHS